MSKKPMIFVYGPTAVGKTEFVDSLIENIDVEVINMDVGQLYKPLTIGTAKPDLNKVKAPHHLFDVIKNVQSLSSVQYRSLVLRKIKEIYNKNKIPVLVGGSYFYLNTLFFPIIEKRKTDSEKTFPEFCKQYQEYDTIYLWNKLLSIDKKRASVIDKGDRYRIERALYVWETTGKIPSSLKPRFSFPGPCVFIYLDREREELKQRIDQRVDIMIKEGLVDEVNGLNDEWKTFLLHKKLIGYNELVMYFKDEMTLPESIKLIKQRTAGYAKRQRTFWRSFKSLLRTKKEELTNDIDIEIYDINLTSNDLSLYLNKLKDVCS